MKKPPRTLKRPPRIVPLQLAVWSSRTVCFAFALRLTQWAPWRPFLRKVLRLAQHPRFTMLTITVQTRIIISSSPVALAAPFTDQAYPVPLALGSEGTPWR